MTAAPTDAPPLGFWKIAEAFPDHLALVDPDEREISAGELLASCNQLVHGLRAHGAPARRRGRDAAAQRRRGVRAVPRRRSGRLLPHPDQLAPRRPRDRVHRAGLRSEGVRRARALRRARQGRGRRDRLPRRGPLRRRRRHRHVPRVRGAEGRSADHRARRPPDGPGHELHVGHDRAPEGRAARAARTSTPRPAAATFGGMLYLFGLQPFDDNVHIVGSPLYHTAVLVFSGAAIHIGHTRRGDGQVDAAADAAPDRQVPRDQHAHGADAVRAAARGARRRAREVRRVVAAAHDPRGGAVPARREAPDARVVGSGDRRVLRRERRWRHATCSPRSGSSTRAPSGASGRSPRS